MAGHRPPSEVNRQKAGIFGTNPGTDPEELRDYFAKYAHAGSIKTLDQYSKEELINRINDYFSSCMMQVVNPVTGAVEFQINRQPTLAGLAVALDTTHAILRGIKPGDDNYEIVEAAKQRITMYYEEKLSNAEKNPAGLIFALKQLGYSDDVAVQPTSRGDRPRSTSDLAAIIKEELPDD